MVFLFMLMLGFDSFSGTFYSTYKNRQEQVLNSLSIRDKEIKYQCQTKEIYFNPIDGNTYDYNYGHNGTKKIKYVKSGQRIQVSELDSSDFNKKNKLPQNIKETKIYFAGDNTEVNEWYEKVYYLGENKVKKFYEIEGLVVKEYEHGTLKNVSKYIINGRPYIYRWKTLENNFNSFGTKKIITFIDEKPIPVQDHEYMKHRYKINVLDYARKYKTTNCIEEELNSKTTDQLIIEKLLGQWFLVLPGEKQDKNIFIKFNKDNTYASKNLQLSNGKWVLKDGVIRLKGKKINISYNLVIEFTNRLTLANEEVELAFKR